VILGEIIAKFLYAVRKCPVNIDFLTGFTTDAVTDTIFSGDACGITI
jgi:hypothetical protein